MRATRAIIHLENLHENIKLVREKTGAMICMPVKADAYGHGVIAVARAALESGAACLAVATVREGEELRGGKIKAPILLLSVPIPEEIPSLVAADLEPLAGDDEYIVSLSEEAKKTGKTVSVHLKIDTVMGRIGCRPDEAANMAAKISGIRGLKLAGTATHLAVSDSLDSGDIAYTKKQLAVFNEAVESIKKLGIDPGIVHAANSGAVTFHDDSWFSMVRPGILLYGYSQAMAVKPLMELESAVVFIKKLKKGEAVSYGRLWTADEDTFIGTIPLGYADGFPRALSNNWQVMDVSGTFYPLVGRICMDQCMVNLGSEPKVKRWDKLVVFGGKAPHAGDMAAKLGTISYEISCGISRRVPRVYTGGTVQNTGVFDD